MAEGKRRSQVKKLVHKTHYHTRRNFEERNLFLDSIIGNGKEWESAPLSLPVPQQGASVLVCAKSPDTVEVAWGNQIVARLTDADAQELYTLLKSLGMSDRVLVAVVDRASPGKEIVFKFSEGVLSEAVHAESRTT